MFRPRAQKRVIRVSPDVKVLWRGQEFRNTVIAGADNISIHGARLVAALAAGFINARAKKKTGHLAGEIVALPSKYKGGGAVAWAQAPGHWTPKFHASFVELGTKRRRRGKKVSPTRQKPMRYMRDAAKMAEPIVQRRYAKMFDRAVRDINRDTIDL